jgi:hypothetical protein
MNADVMDQEPHFPFVIPGSFDFDLIGVHRRSSAVAFL